MLSAGDLHNLIAEAAGRYGLPGVSAAVLHRDEVRVASCGVLNVRTEIPVTDDAVFQIGSITKVFTGTLAMQLVDAGALALDAPVGRYLPELKIAGAPVSNGITVRTLLAHTSGIEGDFFIDTGRNDDAMERYVERCAELDYLTEPGPFSYSNSGYAILGRIIEVVAGESWAARLRSALLQPLGIVALLDPEDTMLYRVAAGHVLDDDGNRRLTPTPFLPRGCEAAGTRLTMSARSLLAFARLHLDDGLAPGGARLLSRDAARAMREVHVRPPVAAGFDGYGLSWALHDAGAPASFGHNGATVGQSAFFRVFPEQDVAVAALANVTSGGAGEAFSAVLEAVLASLGMRYDVRSPEPDPAARFDARMLAGRYDTYMERIVVEPAGDALRATVVRRNNENLAPLRERRLELRPASEAVFIAKDSLDYGSQVVAFTGFQAGVPRFLFWGGRLAVRR